MTTLLEVNEIKTESFKGKDGTDKTALRLVCIDKDNKATTRYQGDLVVEVPKDQVELVSSRLRRDMRIEVELTGCRVFGTQLSYQGRIVPDSIPDVQQGVKGSKPA